MVRQFGVWKVSLKPFPLLTRRQYLLQVPRLPQARDPQELSWIAFGSSLREFVWAGLGGKLELIRLVKHNLAVKYCTHEVWFTSSVLTFCPFLLRFPLAPYSHHSHRFHLLWCNQLLVFTEFSVEADQKLVHYLRECSQPLRLQVLLLPLATLTHLIIFKMAVHLWYWSCRLAGTWLAWIYTRLPTSALTLPDESIVHTSNYSRHYLSCRLRSHLGEQLYV